MVRLGGMNAGHVFNYNIFASDFCDAMEFLLRNMILSL